MRRTSAPLLIAALLEIAACGGAGGDTGGESGTSDETGSTTSPSTTTQAETSSDATQTGSTAAGTDSSTGSADASSGDSGSSSSGAGCRGMTFFATSAGSGEIGGNLGGLDGADALCEGFAAAVGQGDCTWHAYLSTSEEDARDRIGDGPWFNFAGDMIAADVVSLHADGLSNGDPQHVLDENGDEVPGPEHDILTGSQMDGTLLPDATCADWTSDAGGDVARVGHSDIPDPQFSPSWNSAHDSQGCSAADLESTGGAGRLYCFAID